MMQKISVFLIFIMAPFLAIFLVVQGLPAAVQPLVIPTETVKSEIQVLQTDTTLLGDAIFNLTSTIQKQQQVFVQQDEKITQLAGFSTQQKQLSDDIYEQKILKILGPALHAYLSDYSEIKIFDLNELGYRGCIAKVKLFDPSVFRVVLAGDTLGKLETTSNAAKRYSAILAINGGGFYTENRNGTNYAQLIGNTVIDGKLVEPFNGYPGDLFFVGINKKGQVIGTVPQKQEDIMALDPYHGVSF
ncbi:MAG: phosphodiester glycosidase family protein, partial [Syntrophomonadaceae bacterium]|nr:phosphodiester glycosidase family protein [Syntrophomonadaceae bacterium]